MKGLYLELKFLKGKWLLNRSYNTNRKNVFNHMEELNSIGLYAAQSDNKVFMVVLVIVRANHRRFR